MYMYRMYVEKYYMYVILHIYYRKYTVFYIYYSICAALLWHKMTSSGACLDKLACVLVP